MRHWLVAIFILFIIFLFISLGGYLFWITNGKDIIVRHLEDICQHKVYVGDFRIVSPFGLELKNIQIQGLGTIDSLYAASNILSFLTANIVLDEVIINKPQITCERFTEKLEGATTLQAQQIKRNYSFYLLPRKLKVREGSLDFIDHLKGDKKIKIRIEDIMLNLKNLYVFPRSIVTNFDLKGTVPWQNDGSFGKIIFEGWIDLVKRNMQATLKIKDIDGIYLYPYYAQWVNLEKTNIEKAKLNFTSEIQGLKNNLTAECHLELSDLVFKPRAEGEPQDKSEKLAEAVLDIFKDLNKGKIILDFTIKTKMDNLEFGFGDIKSAVEEKVVKHVQEKRSRIKEAVLFPSYLITGTIKGMADVTVAMIDATVFVGRELKNALLLPFRKEKKEAKE